MYIGNDLQIAHPSYKIIDDISSSFNGSTTSFALQVNGQTPVPFPISTQQVMLSVNGVVQEPDPSGSAGFKLLGSNIVFSSAPANGHAFFGVINAGADYVTAGSEFPDGSVTAPSFTFQDDQDTGWYRSGSGAVSYSANGVQKVVFDGNGVTITGSCTATSFSGTISGAASEVTVADESSDTTCFPLFTTAATGNLPPKSGTNLTFNSNTGALTATSFVGALTGNVTGNVTGNTSGTAATVTGAAQSNITSLGTLTGLTVAGNYTQTLSSDGGFTATAAGNHAIQIIGNANRSADQNTLLSLHGKWNGTNVAMIDIQAGDDTSNKDNGQIVFYTAAAGSTAEALRIHEDQSAVFTGSVSDSKGDLRTIVQTSKSSQHTIVATDSGKHSINSSGGWIFNTSTGFTAGEAITLINNSGSDQTITATGVTLYNTADAATGNRTLAGRGMATVICTASNTYYISGAGLS